MELPFNRYSWLTTHNSYATRGKNFSTSSHILGIINQEDSITDQLNVCNIYFSPYSSMERKNILYYKLFHPFVK